jgi:hypothetical protein
LNAYVIPRWNRNLEQITAAGATTHPYRRDTIKPKILGALLDAMSCGLKNHSSVELPRLPRMADAARWVTAAEPAFGWKPQTFLKAFEANRKGIHSVALEGSIVAEGIFTLMNPQFYWEGTASDLLDQLRQSTRPTLLKDLPGSANALSRELDQIAPNLKDQGIEVRRGIMGKRRSIKIEKLT